VGKRPEGGGGGRGGGACRGEGKREELEIDAEVRGGAGGESSGFGVRIQSWEVRINQRPEGDNFDTRRQKRGDLPACLNEPGSDLFSAEERERADERKRRVRVGDSVAAAGGREGGCTRT
jgi:hypothetical protein